MAQNVLEMIGIKKAFNGVIALDNGEIKLQKGSVHALMGENGAGKSTLMKCLFGIYQKDAGTIRVDGSDINYKNPQEALSNGVAMVHQELNQVTKRSVMENIWLGRFPKKYGLVDHKKMYTDTLNLLKGLNIDISPTTIVSRLPISQRQMLEIAKAVSYDAKIIVLDEPTSSLQDKEVAKLFKIIRELIKRGASVIYISHKLEEIKQICDRVTVMRDGSWIETISSEYASLDKIISLMVGRELKDRFPPKTNMPAEDYLEVHNLNSDIIDVSFTARRGEILGLAGLAGSGRTELLETLFGLRTIVSGNIYIGNRKANISSPKLAIKEKLALITEERRATGIFSILDINFNSTVSNLNKYKRFGLLRDNLRYQDTDWVVNTFGVKTPSNKTAIIKLSGGNQQKVILGRWLLTNPEILLLDEPTRGIDVGAKYEIYKIIIDLATKGKTIIFSSSEMPELLGITDRLIVMSNKRISAIVDTANTSQEEIMELASKLY